MHYPQPTTQTTAGMMPRRETAVTRNAQLLWMKDILEHMTSCYEQWQDADSSSDYYLAETMKRDLDEARRLCDALRREAPASAHRAVA